MNSQHSSSKRTAANVAAEYGHSWCLQALIAAGADLNIKDHVDKTALMNAVERGKTDCVKLLVEVGADVNTKDSNHTVLTAAVKKGRTDCVRLLIAAARRRERA